MIKELNIRFDPWAPDYGSSMLASEESEQWLKQNVEVDVSLEVEESAWRPIPCEPSASTDLRIGFIDGVRRIESNLVFEHFQYGAFASCAAGGVVLSRGRLNNMEQSLIEWAVQRYLIVPESLECPDVIDIPQRYPRGSQLTLNVARIAGTDPMQSLQAIQRLMRQEEALIAERMISGGQVDLVIADGPLNLPLMDQQIAGYIKSIHTLYVPSSLYPVLSQIRKHERTPLFLLSRDDGMRRYSCFVRITDPPARDSELAGISRFEISGAFSVEQAQQLLSLCGSQVPSFASPYGRDPRAPQNLLPLSALESELRRRMGNPEILKRIFQDSLVS